MSSIQEEMLNAIANGDIINEEPRCRREQFLKAIANGEGTADLPDPNCREEKYLMAIAEKGIGGGDGSGGITPSGTILIEENGTFDVTNYANAEVNVNIVTPSGILTITENGTYNVSDHAWAEVNVPSQEPNLIAKEITENGTYNAIDEGADGYSVITVNVASSGSDNSLVITTQEEFDAWVTSLNDGTCTASSVLIVGDGGTTTFTTSSALTLPDTLYRIEGVNSAKISASAGGFKYTTQKTSSDYSISNLYITHTGAGCTFTNCCNLHNLTIITSPGQVSTTKNGRNPSCLYHCTNIYDCTIKAYASNGYSSSSTSIIMYEYCENFFNVTSTASYSSTFSTFGSNIMFRSCSNIYACNTSMSQGNKAPSSTTVYKNCNVIVGSTASGTCGGTYTKEDNCTNVFDITIEETA